MAAHLSECLYLPHQSLFHHLVYTTVNVPIDPLSVIIQDKVSKPIRGNILPLFFVVVGNALPCLFIKLDGADHPFHIVSMNALAGGRIHRPEPLIERLRPISARQFLERMAKCSVLIIFRKIDVIEQRLNIKAGAAHQNGNPPPSVNLRKSLLRQFLKYYHVKGLCGFQHIDQMMGHPLHLFRSDLRGSYIHMAVHLHGVGGDDLPAYGLCQGNGQSGFPHSRRACQNHQWSLPCLLCQFHLLLFTLLKI